MYPEKWDILHGPNMAVRKKGDFAHGKREKQGAVRRKGVFAHGRGAGCKRCPEKRDILRENGGKMLKVSRKMGHLAQEGWRKCYLGNEG